jgi:hypothetical protein
MDGNSSICMLQCLLGASFDTHTVPVKGGHALSLTKVAAVELL